MAGILSFFSKLGSGDCNRTCEAASSLWRHLHSAAFNCSTVADLSYVISGIEAPPASDYLVATFTLAGALGILQVFDELAKRDYLNKKLSRKLCHILSGLVFMLFWPFFSSAPLAKYMAAFAPAANGLRMIGLGLGLWTNEALVKAISREGGKRELLHGPLYYATTITLSTLFFWRNSPIGICAIATLCAGDGVADIFGRRYGTYKLPYNSSKSYAGSLAFFLFASLASMGYVAIFSSFGFFTATADIYLATVGVTLASAFAESLPLPIDDNFTVPFTAMGVGLLLLPY
jgi:farnesol kinase